MKKLITLLLLTAIFVGAAYSQKVSFSLTNPRLQGGYFMYDLMATIPSGQNWAVGSCNIRINFTANPANSLVVKADNPAVNANPNISGANGYQNMTTTSILNGTAISLNILTFNTSGFYRFTPGIYLIATLRWTATPPVNNTQMTFRVPPDQYPTLVFDSLVQLAYPSGFTVVQPTPTGVIQIANELPTEYQLYQNYPNPFNPVTTIKYDIPKKAFVTIKVYDITGREVGELVNQEQEQGRYEISWSADKLASGIYFYTIRTQDFSDTKRMVLIK